MGSFGYRYSNDAQVTLRQIPLDFAIYTYIPKAEHPANCSRRECREHRNLSLVLIASQHKLLPFSHFAPMAQDLSQNDQLAK